MKIFYALLFVVGLLHSVDATENSSRKNPTFAFVYACPSGQDSFCLLGKHQLGLSVNLLHKTKSSVCTATTDKLIVEEDTDLIFTELVTSANCEKVGEYAVSMAGTAVPAYEILRLRKVTDEDIITAMDKTVRKTKVIEDLLKRSAGLITNYPLDSSLPVVNTIHGANIHMLEYKVTQDENLFTGPRVLVIENKVHPLTGQCSHSEFHAFRLNNKYYIESGSHCCECGITGKEIFRIDDNQIVIAFQDYSLSD